MSRNYYYRALNTPEISRQTFLIAVCNYRNKSPSRVFLGQATKPQVLAYVVGIGVQIRQRLADIAKLAISTWFLTILSRTFTGLATVADRPGANSGRFAC